MQTTSKGEPLFKAISNLVDATELAHNNLSKKIESATAQGSEVSRDKLAELRLQTQELDVTSVILKRTREEVNHRGLAQQHHLSLTRLQFVECLVCLLTGSCSHGDHVSPPSLFRISGSDVLTVASSSFMVMRVVNPPRRR